MEEGNNNINNERRENALIIMGLTGVGKSTLAALFGKLGLICKFNKSMGEYFIENS